MQEYLLKAEPISLAHVSAHTLDIDPITPTDNHELFAMFVLTFYNLTLLIIRLKTNKKLEKKF